jgi:tetratricopeptide (TPR) repeat protein/tRNA A-37 threonylcarbamoyl transferase component Bud32
MSEPENARTDHDSLSATQIEALDRVCDEFEAALRAGNRPKIEDHLANADESVRSALLSELITLEFHWRASHGERPEVAEYENRFPAYAAAVGAGFARSGAEVPTTVHHGLSTQEPAHDAANLTPERFDDTVAGQRFHIVRPHARGGLGEVLLALDAELNREVALKRILDRHADDPGSRRRFLGEAEITGGLEHPGIVPVYALGAYRDGRPFYAMRFIRGASLKEAIERFHHDEGLKRDPGKRSLELRKLLRRFLDVCNAIDYAHSRGVLHRDIKPANIILGKHGETLIVDWGLAKATGQSEPGLEERTLLPSSASGSAETLPGSVLGTPSYMSPEQARGELDQLGPRSDVYSLGATLYCLLTCKPPHEGDDVRELLHKARRGDFARPKQVDPSIAKPLEAVCLKAMAARPADRYASSRMLAEDIERWMADEPVTACPEPVSVRAARWMRQHRTAMIGAAAAGLVGLLGLATVAAVQSQAKSALEKKNRQLTEAHAATNRALDAETKAKEAATEALAKSEESRKRAEAVLGFLKDDVLAAARPEGQEGGLGVDATVRKAVDAAEPKIVVAFKDQPIVEAEIRNTLGTTYLYLSEPTQAIRQFERVVALRQTTFGPDHPDTLSSRRSLGTAYQIAGRATEAVKMYEATLKLFESKLGPEHLETLNCRNDLASALVDAGRVDEAITLHKATLKRMEKKVGYDHPDTVTCRANLAEAYSFAGRVDEAIKLHEEALKQCETTLGPDHPDTLISRNNLALAYKKAGRIADCIRMDEGTLRLRESKLGPDHPLTLTTCNNLALAYQAVGRFDEAIKLLEAIIMRRETKLGPDHPDTFSGRNNLALVYADAGRFDEAIKLHWEALERSEANLGRDHPRTLILRNNLAVAYREAGQIDRAVSLLEQVVKDLRAKVGPDHPNTLKVEQNLADAYAAAGTHATAETLLRDVVERARKRFGSGDPNTTATLASLGSNLIQQRKWAEAEPTLRECLTSREKTQPDDWSTFNIRALLGASLLGQRKYADVEPLILAGYDGMKAREAKIPSRYKRCLTETAERVVQLYEAWGKDDKAAEWKARAGIANLPAEVFARP